MNRLRNYSHPRRVHKPIHFQSYWNIDDTIANEHYSEILTMINTQQVIWSLVLLENVWLKFFKISIYLWYSYQKLIFHLISCSMLMRGFTNLGNNSASYANLAVKFFFYITLLWGSHVNSFKRWQQDISKISKSLIDSFLFKF